MSGQVHVVPVTVSVELDSVPVVQRISCFAGDHSYEQFMSASYKHCSLLVLVSQVNVWTFHVQCWKVLLSLDHCEREYFKYVLARVPMCNL